MKKAILFGASNLGETARKVLKDKYDIICFCDNDKEKWNSKFLDLNIIQPDQLNKFEDTTIIVTSIYHQEISIQLVQLGIKDIKIFKQDFNDNMSEEYKLDELLTLKEESRNLNCNEIQQLYNIAPKNEIDKKSKILIMCSFFSVYVKEYIEKLSKINNILFDILTTDKGYIDNISKICINNIYTYNNVKQFMEILEYIDKYEIIHIHYLDPIYGKLYKLILNKCSKLIITIWGSDFYRTSPYEKLMQEPIIRESYVITFDNELVEEEFVSYFGDATKSCICRFGLTALENISSMDIKKSNIRKEYNIPKESITITCGYNAKEQQNHIDIINGLNRLNKNIKKKIFLIIPMTYGKDNLKYIEQVKLLLSHQDIQYIVLEEFMNFNEVAKITLATDIFIHVQDTDTLSATMQEQLFAENIVLVGEWLPYDILRKLGIYSFGVDNLNNIDRVLNVILSDIDSIKIKCKNNKNIIWKLSSWDNTINDWIKLYN